MDLKTAMKVAGLDQKGLAKKAGVSHSLISRLLNGTRCKRPSYESIVRISRALNLAPDELFPIDDAPARKDSKRSRRVASELPA